jgi:hypothetical protein
MGRAWVCWKRWRGRLGWGSGRDLCGLSSGCYDEVESRPGESPDSEDR